LYSSVHDYINEAPSLGEPDMWNDDDCLHICVTPSTLEEVPI
jgi:hypothetical protein